MSIWCSWQTIGWDDEGEGVGGMVIDDSGVRDPRPHWNFGHVRAYAEGWSNHYPDATVETPASIGIATVPTWCVPGHAEEFSDDVGPWLRLDVDAEGAPDYWHKDGDEPARRSFHDAVVLDEDAALALRDNLTAWLDLPKSRPLGEEVK